jgi:hypothetical protein
VPENSRHQVQADLADDSLPPGGSLSLPRSAHGPRPANLGEDHLDNLLSMILVLAQELWVVSKQVELLSTSIDTMVEAGSFESWHPPDLDFAEDRLPKLISRLLRSTVSSAGQAEDAGDEYREIVERLKEA